MQTMLAITVNQKLKDTIAKLKKQTDDLIDRIKRDTETITQFTSEFPDIYVLEKPEQKKERIRQ